jgi:hypothetical protein
VATRSLKACNVIVPTFAPEVRWLCDIGSSEIPGRPNKTL